MGALPEAHSDMIFDAFSEEIGLLGNLLLLGLYFGLFYNVIRGLEEIKDPYFKPGICAYWCKSLNTSKYWIDLAFCKSWMNGAYDQLYPAYSHLQNLSQ